MKEMGQSSMTPDQVSCLWEFQVVEHALVHWAFVDLQGVEVRHGSLDDLCFLPLVQDVNTHIFRGSVVLVEDNVAFDCD